MLSPPLDFVLLLAAALAGFWLLYRTIGFFERL